MKDLEFIKEQVLLLVSDISLIDIENINLEDKLVDDLYLDTLDIEAIIASLEHQFELPFNSIRTIENKSQLTVQDLINVL